MDVYDVRVNIVDHSVTLFQQVSNFVYVLITVRYSSTTIMIDSQAGNRQQAAGKHKQARTQETHDRHDEHAKKERRQTFSKATLPTKKSRPINRSIR